MKTNQAQHFDEREREISELLAVVNKNEIEIVREKVQALKKQRTSTVIFSTYPACNSGN